MDTGRLAFQAAPAHSSTVARQVESNYNISIGYLRAFVTLLVLAHHATLAYAPSHPSRRRR